MAKARRFGPATSQPCVRRCGRSHLGESTSPTISVAKLLSKDEARRIAANIARMRIGGAIPDRHRLVENLRSLRWRRLARHDVDRSSEHRLNFARLKHQQLEAIVSRLHGA